MVLIEGSKNTRVVRRYLSILYQSSIFPQSDVQGERGLHQRISSVVLSAFTSGC